MNSGEFDYKLCILVPAYNYYNGVLRIYDSILDHPDISLIISDDSDDECAIKLRNLIENADDQRFSYHKGSNTGAADNWNSLVERSNAEFYVLMHHDEAFSDFDFLDNLYESQETLSDCYILPCRVIKNSRVFRDLTSCQQKITLNWVGKFLPVINFIGPTSVLILNSSLKHKFNNQLKWFIDTEWYFRVINNVGRGLCFLEGGSYIESHSYAGSITNSSISSIHTLSRSERKLLSSMGYNRTVSEWNAYGFITARIVMYAAGFKAYLAYFLLLLRARF